MSSEQGSPTRAILYAFLANFGIAVTKTVRGRVHELRQHARRGDPLVRGLREPGAAVLRLKQAARPPTPEHPLGFGKLLLGFVVALMLFSIGGLFSIYEGWHKLHAPEPLHKAWVALGVLGMSILLETASLARLPARNRRLRGDRGFAYWLRNTQCRTRRRTRRGRRRLPPRARIRVRVAGRAHGRHALGRDRLDRDRRGADRRRRSWPAASAGC